MALPVPRTPTPDDRGRPVGAGTHLTAYVNVSLGVRANPTRRRGATYRRDMARDAEGGQAPVAVGGVGGRAGRPAPASAPTCCPRRRRSTRRRPPPHRRRRPRYPSTARSPWPSRWSPVSTPPTEAPRSSRRRAGPRPSSWRRSRRPWSGRSTFYSDGVHTLLGPTGWTCARVASGTSGQSASAPPPRRPPRPPGPRSPPHRPPGSRRPWAPPVRRPSSSTRRRPVAPDLGRAAAGGGGHLRHLRVHGDVGRRRPRVPVLRHPVVAGAARPGVPRPNPPASSPTP